MATDINTITVSGRLGNEPDSKFTESGTAVLSFNLANGTYKKGAGEYNTLTTWYRCSIIGKRAESAMNLLNKGSRIAVTGTHSIREYTDKDGNTRQSNEINVDNFFLLDGRGDNNGAEAPTKPVQARSNGRGKNVPQPVVDDSELPF